MSSPIINEPTIVGANIQQSTIGDISSGDFLTLTAATQSPGDNSRNAATTAFVQAALTAALTSLASWSDANPGWLQVGPIIIQWGSTGTLPDSTQQLITLPKQFPNHFWGAVAVMNNNIGSNVRTMQCIPANDLTFNIQANGSGSSAFWIAVGD